MKRVVSVSLGSSKRDHTARVEILGKIFEISRRGTDGDFQKALELLQELDGKVDAIGLGGIDVYVYVRGKRYAIEDGLRLMRAVARTPVVDGSGLKNTLEREAVRYLTRETEFLRPGTKVLVVSAVDRFGMAEALTEAGCDLVFGDLIFALGIPHPIRTLPELERIANKLLPEMVKLPIEKLYPIGKKQETQDTEKTQKFARFYNEAQVIAGDFHLIRRFLPEKLSGQVILTNTTTKDDVALLKERGAGWLVTTTPEYEGRSFGTNVMEAVFVVLIGRPWGEIVPENYMELLRRINYRPRITPLN